MNIKAVVDRIEDSLAVLEVEGKAEVIWPVKFLPSGTKSGDILNIIISQNPQAEAEQREKIKKIQEKLKNR